MTTVILKNLTVSLMSLDMIQVLAVDSTTLFTGLWPLKNFGGPIALKEFVDNTVHRRQHAGIDGTKTTDKADNAGPWRVP